MTSPHITWAEIMAEAEHYKQGFVALYRKYEGATTDERDSANRVVKVTANSFARHFGIGESQFRRWIKKAEEEVGVGADADLAAEVRKREFYDRTARSAVRNDTEAVIQAIKDAPVETQRRIIRESKENYLYPENDNTTAGKKARQAGADEATEPIRRSLNKFTGSIAFTNLASALKEAVEYLAEYKESDEVTTEEMVKIHELYDELTFGLIEMGALEK